MERAARKSGPVGSPPRPLVNDLAWAPSWERPALLRVELDDQLLLDGHGDVLARRRRLHGALERALVQVQPRRDAAAVHRLERLVDPHHPPRPLAELDAVARAAEVAGDVDLAAVHGEVAVAHELAGLVARVGEA